MLVISPGRAQLAWHLASGSADFSVGAFYLDLYQAEQARLAASEQGASIQVLCAADLPPDELDVVALPVLKHSESELTREWMQQAHQRLVAGGWLAVAVDNPRDNWLREQMGALFEKVTCVDHPLGRAYWAQKKSPLKRERNFQCQFQFRDQGHLVQAVSRPGVFSHRKLDAGARQLLNAVAVGPEDRVLDMGCGSGSVALACGLQTTQTVYAVDANARAVECVRDGAALNGLGNIQAIWNADGQLGLSQHLDLALANPPYFGDQRIWRHFMDVCIASLRVGGGLLVVTKQPSWFIDYLDDKMEDLGSFQSSSYVIVHGNKL